jgi:hypothetical protein
VYRIDSRLVELDGMWGSLSVCWVMLMGVGC